MGRFYITTPIYYVNDAPHVGHAYCTVNADALARWHRLRGDETLFLTGTDEHGQKVAEAAASRGVDPKAWTDQTSQRFQDAWAELEISNDQFIRTTEPRHRDAVQSFLQAIYDNGYIYKGTYRGPYCVSCEDYYTDEQLDGGRCPVHGREVIEMEEDNYFFKLSAFQDQLLAWYEANPGGVRPATKRNEALGFIKGGLRDISISRTSISWGIPVPWDEEHVFYVWYDALINYLTALGYGTEASEVDRWWPSVHHLIGKEIIRFHCVWWPAMCLAAGVEPPANVLVHGWLLVGGQKLSKSMADGGEAPVRLTDIAPQALAADLGVDALRYHLLRDTPLGSDGEFSYEGIVARYNADLANNLGNLTQRLGTLVGSKCGGLAPAPAGAIAAAVDEHVAAAAAAWDRLAPHEALEQAWRVIAVANAHLEAHEPWKAEAGDPAAAGVLGDALEALRLVTVLATPAMPEACAEIRRRMGFAVAADHDLEQQLRWGQGEAGASVEKGEPLFPRRKAG